MLVQAFLLVGYRNINEQRAGAWKRDLFLLEQLYLDLKRLHEGVTVLRDKEIRQSVRANTEVDSITNFSHTPVDNLIGPRSRPHLLLS